MLLKHKKTIFILWRVSMAVWLFIYGVRLFAARSPFVSELMRSTGYNIALYATIGVALLFNILCSIIQHKEKRQ